MWVLFHQYFYRTDLGLPPFKLPIFSPAALFPSPSTGHHHLILITSHTTDHAWSEVEATGNPWLFWTFKNPTAASLWATISFRQCSSRWTGPLLLKSCEEKMAQDCLYKMQNQLHSCAVQEIQKYPLDWMGWNWAHGSDPGKNQSFLDLSSLRFPQGLLPDEEMKLIKKTVLSRPSCPWGSLRSTSASTTRSPGLWSSQLMPESLLPLHNFVSFLEPVTPKPWTKWK